ncbi:AAA family ATPase [Corynebacterium rhinophilum]|uniref:AAA family ATPase n=1 Tax=Corynebacterium rhinophilum TaxID=3050197 RepID=UPI00254BF7B8|nr:AAA family ATPase [Corynebacterium sp. MSK156]MDK8785828.1 AAA family ATPase [Corynebacterium sp. MSK156]
MSDPQQTFSWRTVLPIVLETMRDATLVSYPEIFERVQKIAEVDFPEQAHRQLKNRTAVEDRTRWAVFHAREIGFVTSSKPGSFSLTAEGATWLASNPYPLSKDQIRELGKLTSKTNKPQADDTGPQEQVPEESSADFFWVLRAGSNGEREKQALASNQGLPGMDYGPEVNQQDSLDAIKASMVREHPDLKAQTATSYASQLNRFKNEMQIGDLVLMPSKLHQGRVYFGCVSGNYEYHPNDPKDLRHVRPINWSSDFFNRDDLGLDLQRSLGSLLTICQISRNHAYDRVESVIQGMGDPEFFSETPLSPSFDWPDFFEEFATKLLAFKDNRAELLEKLKETAEISGRPLRFKHLWKWSIDDAEVPATDMDPFTILGVANRQISVSNKRAICQAFKAVFGIEAPAPTDFSGLPQLNNLRSCFTTKPSDVKNQKFWDNSWSLFESAIGLSQSDTPENRAKFMRDFDVMTKDRSITAYTMALFWARPLYFLTFDSVITKYLAQESALGINIQKNVSTGKDYLLTLDDIREWLTTAEIEPANFPRLSYEAWVFNQEPTDATTQTAESSSEEDPFTIPKLIEEGCFIPKDDLELMLERLKEKKNLILQGPPGTGKTWLARRLAYILCKSDAEELVTSVQFHPSTSYEDFVQGFRPSSNGKLELRDGPFLHAVEKAKENDSNPHVVVIEEINRGNPAQIFGEMLTLLEADKRNPENALTTLYSQEGEAIFLPDNFYVIGTMNQADRSLAMVDMALRRRFAFVNLVPQLGSTWRNFCVSNRNRNGQALIEIARRIEEVNQLIRDDFNLGDDYLIGHSFVTPRRKLTDSSYEATIEWFNQVVTSDLKPLIGEYWFDNPSKREQALDVLTG